MIKILYKQGNLGVQSEGSWSKTVDELVWTFSSDLLKASPRSEEKSEVGILFRLLLMNLTVSIRHKYIFHSIFLSCFDDCCYEMLQSAYKQ